MSQQQGQRFRRRALRRGYKVDEVDEFLTRVEATLEGQAHGNPVRARDVHDYVFRVRFGGYDEWQVDMHLDRVERELTALEEGGGLPPAEPASLNAAPDSFALPPGDSYATLPQSEEPMRAVREDEPTMVRAARAAAAVPPPAASRPASDPAGPEVPMPPGAAPAAPPMPDRPAPVGHAAPPPAAAEPVDFTQKLPPVRADVEPVQPRAVGHREPEARYEPDARYEPEGRYEPDRHYEPRPRYEPEQPPEPAPRYVADDRFADGERFTPEPPRFDTSGEPQRFTPEPQRFSPEPPRFDPRRSAFTREEPSGPYEAEPGRFEPEPPQFGAPGQAHPPQPQPEPERPAAGVYGGGRLEPGRHGKVDMTAEIPAADSPFTPDDLHELDLARQSFTVRRFGSGYDPAQVNRLFDAIAATMSGRATVQVSDSELDPGQFSLVQGGLFEAEVDTALRSVRDMFARKGIAR